jgi:Uma2 family endonuclease
MVTTRLMTAEELAAMPDDGYRYELVDGELIRMSPTGFLHLQISGLLIALLGGHVRERGLGVVGGEGGFVFRRGPDKVYAPDVVFVRAERLPPKEAWTGFLDIVPDLAVEVLSPSDTADHINDKVITYLETGVRLVWVVDPRRRTVTVYQPDLTARVLREGNVLDGGEVLPEFRLPLAELFG